MLIHTKLQRPGLRQDSIQRPHLIGRLNRGLDRKLTLFSAQAGAGKTTLLLQWLAQCPQPSAWLALDHYDNDLTLFASYLSAAICAVLPGACEQNADLLHTSQTPPPRFFLTSLVNQLSAYFAARSPSEDAVDAGPGLIVALDDFHTITAPEIHGFVADLVAYLPAQVHLALTSRTDPPLPLAALRARRELNELRTFDLRFSRQEADILLETMLERRLNQTIVDLLEEATEGWAVGLRLAGLSLRYTPDELGFATKFRETSSAMVVDYLMHEVLAQQSPVVREFLLATSILDRFDADLCDAILEDRTNQRNDVRPVNARLLLQEINRANLFLLPLDQEGRWFRYHPLFRDLLQHLLQREHRPERVRGRHRHAARWFAEQELIEEALTHAFAADDADLAVQILAARRYALMNGAQWLRLERHLRRFPADLIHEQPELLMAKIWLLYHNGHIAQLPAALGEMEAALATADPAAATVGRLRGEMSALHSLLAYYQTDAATALVSAQFAIAATARELWSVRILARLFLAGAYQMQGDFPKAEATILSGLHEETDDSHPHTATLVVSSCYLYWVAGDLDSLAHAARRTIRYCDYSSAAEIERYARHHLGCAAYLQNDLTAAEENFTAVVQQPYSNYGDAYVNAVFGLALTYQAKGRAEAARAVIGDAIASLTERGNATLLAVAQAAQAEIAWRQGDLAAAEQWASRISPAPPLSPMTQLCRPHLILVKVWLAHDTPGSRQQATRLLDRLEEHAELTHNTVVLIEVLALQALVLAARQEVQATQSKLVRALALARPGKVIRLFVDLGTPMAHLLQDLMCDDEACCADIGDNAAGILAAFVPTDYGHPRTNGDRTQPDSIGAESLTPRERDVLDLLARRMTNREIATELVIAPGTVKTHTLNIYAKLDVHNRRQAVDKAEQLGLVKL